MACAVRPASAHTVGRLWLLGILCGAGLAGCGGSGAEARAAAPSSVPRADCETTVVPASFATSAELWTWEERLHSYGIRATANPAHQAFVEWLDGELAAIPAMELRRVDYPIERWTASSASLLAGSTHAAIWPVAVSGIVPYARATGNDGVSAPLAYLPADTAITPENAAGRIVLRDVAAGSQPNAAYAAVLWWLYDPGQRIARQINGRIENKQGVRADDLLAAQAAGAAGLIFMHEFPREQVLDLYRPYSGVHWAIPALQVGVDEAQHLRELAAAGGHARIAIDAVTEPATTRMLVATLPGIAEDALVIESHTDGTNALWDNGPLAMLAMARYFGQFERACRSRTLQFVFTTGHLYQELAPPYRGGSAALFAQEMDQAYEDGRASAVVVIEHLGAREYAAVPRVDRPGRELQLTDRSELNTFFVTESAGLQAALLDAVVRHDLRESLALRGASLPGAHLPLSDNFGGEGNAYIRHLLPTIAFIVAPWTLFTPQANLEGIDGELLHRQTLVFADLVLHMSRLPREALAGAATLEREQRDVLCASGRDVSGIVMCEGTPSAPAADPT